MGTLFTYSEQFIKPVAGTPKPQTKIMKNKSKATKNTLNTTNSSSIPTEADCYEGERLVRLLKYLRREIVKLLDGNSLPEKFWFKQQFAIGVNEVTRVLERMPQAGAADKGCSAQRLTVAATSRKVPLVHLQAILVASDCNPKWLIKHLPGLALSRNVPFIYVKDNKGGSLRLGELVNLKTAIAIGVKAKGNGINQIVEEILRGNEVRQEVEQQDQCGNIVHIHAIFPEGTFSRERKSGV